MLEYIFRFVSWYSWLAPVMPAVGQFNKEISMSFLPVINYEVKSIAKPSEIAAILRPHVQSFPTITRLDGHKTFTGSVSETGFRFLRVGEGRNSFRPTVLGIFSQSNQFTIILVTIKYDAYFFIPVAIMFLLFTLFSLQTSYLPLLTALFSKNVQEVQKYLSAPNLFFLLAPLAMLFVSYFFAYIFFGTEANAAKKELAEILAPITFRSEKHL